MAVGTKKMPLPITVPTTIEEAPHSPSTRFNSGLVSGMGIPFEKRERVSGEEGDAGTDEDVPGPGYRSEEPYVNHGRQACQHAADGVRFLHAPREDAQQENAQQAAVDHRGDGEAGLQHRTPMPRQQPDAEQDQAPGGGT